LHLEPEVNEEAVDLASFCARELVWWGVRLQRQGALEQAAPHFTNALELNPDNLAAELDLAANQRLREHGTNTVSAVSAEDRFKWRRRWSQVLNSDGPFDEPAFCLRLGGVFAQAQLYRQAAQEYERVRFLVPGSFDARLMLAKMDLLRGFSAEALNVVAETRADSQRLGFSSTNLNQLLLVELAAHLAEHDVAGAERAVRAALGQVPGDLVVLTTAARVYLNYGVLSNATSTIQSALAGRPDDPSLHLMAAQVSSAAKDNAGMVRSLDAALVRSPEDEAVLAAAAQLYLNASMFSNAVAMADRQIKANPGNPQAFLNRGYASLQLGAYDQAVQSLTRAIELDTAPSSNLRVLAQLDRAIASLRAQNLGDALRDYEAIRRTHPTTYQVYYGLQEIAYQKKDFKKAVRYCQSYLQYAPAGTEEAKIITARLKELQPGSR